jgi:AraC-like DNA-binding protein
MLEQIESGYDQAITVRTMSATVGRQPAYMGRLFFQKVGSSVREYLTRVRLEHAAALIRDGVKIEAVALSVGYRSKKNFYRQFKRCYGTTPVRYRTGSVETRSEPQSRTALNTSRDEGIVVTAAPTDPGFKNEKPITAASEPAVSRLVSIVRASNHSWRLAVRAQDTMLQLFTRLRVGVLLTNDVCRYVGANRAAVSVTGYSMADLYNLSPSDLFVTAPIAEMRCVWQLVLLRPYRPNQSPNAMVRTKGGDTVAVHLVILKNVPLGRLEMSAMLERAKPLMTG